MPGPSSLLIAMPTWVGDAVLATTLIEAMHEHYPEARKDFLVKPYLRGLLDDAPWLGHVFEWSGKRGFWSLRLALARSRHDWGILLSNSLRPALLMWMARVPRRVGYVRNGRGPLLTDRLAFPDTQKQTVPFRMVDFYARIGGALGLPNAQRGMRLYVGERVREQADRLFEARGLTGGMPVIGLNPGAKYGSSKLWPTGYFARTADALIGEFDAQVVLLAGPGEDELAGEIRRAMERPAVVLPSSEVNLEMLKALTMKLDLMITNDTGPRHIAAAFGTPTVTVFGPTHTRWGDTASESAVDLALEVDCGPCMQRTCPLKHHKCMVDLKPDAVISAAVTLLGKHLPTRPASSDRV
ncbi:MAG: lipopolysaccharide heptosyltransferase II [Planctomycetota bacterium]|jgi:heptosyltransferase-2